jgi:hypothetical protein
MKITENFVSFDSALLEIYMIINTLTAMGAHMSLAKKKLKIVVFVIKSYLTFLVFFISQKIN